MCEGLTTRRNWREEFQESLQLVRNPHLVCTAKLSHLNGSTVTNILSPDTLCSLICLTKVTHGHQGSEQQRRWDALSVRLQHMPDTSSHSCCRGTSDNLMKPHAIHALQNPTYITGQLMVIKQSATYRLCQCCVWHVCHSSQGKKRGMLHTLNHVSKTTRYKSQSPGYKSHEEVMPA